MKQIALSIEQMKHLQKLGLDTSDASMYWNEEPEITCHVNYYPNDLEVNETPTYTLQDILNKFPDIIETDSDNFECHINLYQNYVTYRDSKHNTLLNIEFGEDILEAAHNMLVWCIENKHIETK